MSRKYLLDTTSIITIISDICNDPKIGERFGTVEGWQKKNNNIYRQIVDEKDKPVLSKLLETIGDGEWFAIEQTIQKINDIVGSNGSALEKIKLAEILPKIKVIDKSLTKSINVHENKIWSELNKSVFGTAISQKMIVVSGNIYAIQWLVDNKIIKDEFVAHRSRCFVGTKY